MSTQTEDPAVAVHLAEVKASIRSWVLGEMSDTGVPGDLREVLYAYEFMAFRQSLHFAVQAVFDMDVHAGIDGAAFQLALIRYQPSNAEYLYRLFQQVAQVVAGHGERVVFRPDADAADIAVAMTMIGTIACGITARTTEAAAGSVADRVLTQSETSPVMEVLPTPSAVLATRRDADSPDPAGGSLTYGESSQSDSIVNLADNDEDIRGIAATVALMEGASSVLFAGSDRDIPFIGVDASVRQELVAFADDVTAQGSDVEFGHRFDAICEKAAPAIAMTFAFENPSERFSVLIPYTDEWAGYLEYVSEKGYLVFLFRTDLGKIRPEEIDKESGMLVATFDGADLMLAVNRVAAVIS